MGGWTGIALALRGPADDRMASRLPTSLHPLAGRPVAWHVLRAISGARPPPCRILYCTVDSPELPGLGHPAEVVAVTGGDWWAAIASHLGAGDGGPFLVECGGRAQDSLDTLIGGAPGRALRSAQGEPLAVWIADRAILERCAAGGLEALADACETVPPADPDRRSWSGRASLAHAGAVISSG